MKLYDNLILEINQGAREAECIAIADGRALVMYSMPAGRQFLLEWPEATTVDEAERYAPLPRNISANKPPKRWAAAVAEYKPQQLSDEDIERKRRRDYLIAASAA